MPELDEILIALRADNPENITTALFGNTPFATALESETQPSMESLLLAQNTPVKPIGWMVWDKQRQEQVGATRSTLRSASRRADKLDLEYGASRYYARPIYPLDPNNDK